MNEEEAFSLRPYFLLALLVFWHGGLLAWWLRQDTRPPRWDQSVHISTAWTYKEALNAGDWKSYFQVKPHPGHPPYPPLVHNVMIPFMTFAEATGHSIEDAAAFSNWVFVTLLGLATFLLASQLWGAERGVLAAALAMLMPPVLVYSREPLVDIALAAWVVFAYAFWIRSQNFTRPLWCALLGAAAGLGLLTKWSFPFYVIPIAVDGAFALFRKNREGLRGFGLALLIAVLLSGPWYILNGPAVLPRILRSAGQGGAEGDPSIFTAAAWAWYPHAAADQIYLGGAALAVFGIFWLLFRHPWGTGFLLAWILTGYVFWSAVSNKNDRYFLPVLAAFPVVFASAPRWITKAAAGLALIFSAWFTAAPEGLWLPSSPPQAAGWPLVDIVETADQHRPGKPLSVISLVSNHEFMNGNNFAWTLQRRGVAKALAVRTKITSLGELSDFVVIKTGDLGPYTGAAREEARREALKPGGWFSREFKNLKTWNLPDGSQAMLFGQKVELPPLTLTNKTRAAILDRLVPGASSAGLTAKSAGPGAEIWRIKNFSTHGFGAGDMVLRIEGLRAAVDDDGAPRLLRIDKVFVESAELSAAAVAALLAKKVKGLEVRSWRWSEGAEGITAECDGRWKNRDVRLTLRLALADGRPQKAQAVLEQLKIGPVKVPGFILRRAGRFTFSLAPQKGMPFELGFAPWRVAPGSDGAPALKVGEHEPTA